MLTVLTSRSNNTVIFESRGMSVSWLPGVIFVTCAVRSSDSEPDDTDVEDDMSLAESRRPATS